jgi:hypothetical protein
MPNRLPRSRIDSTANLHRILAGANVQIAPPVHVPLADDDWPFWHSIVDEYARADWTPHQLEIAAILARAMAMLERSQRLLRDEGPVQKRPSGILGRNPRLRIVDQLLGQVLALRRSLALTGRAHAGSSEEATRKRLTNRHVERTAAGRNDLLS